MKAPYPAFSGIFRSEGHTASFYGTRFRLSPRQPDVASREYCRINYSIGIVYPPRIATPVPLEGTPKNHKILLRFGNRSTRGFFLRRIIGDEDVHPNHDFRVVLQLARLLAGEIGR